MLHPTKEENGEIHDVTCGEAIMHFISIGWKVIFATLCPPPHYLGGWPTFFAGISCIGGITYVVAEVAKLFGCIIGMRDGLNAITFVAVGTSLPDTFASMTAARSSRYADEAVGNITGSNCVNVFLGLGLPWIIATIWRAASQNCKDNPDDVFACNYKVPTTGLQQAVILFLSCSATGFLLLILRRVFVKGELGGSAGGRYGSGFFMVLLWFVYVSVAGVFVYSDLIWPKEGMNAIMNSV